MEFTLEELETIKDALTVALMNSEGSLDDSDAVIRILDRIDEENDLD